jgi:TolB-like protein/cytochrome c-type biogenesis protein CcmH/NrfG
MDSIQGIKGIGDRLECWKEIASYFGRDVRTVQLWEKTEGLPVYRHMHGVRGTVHALVSELDSWRISRQSCSSQERRCINLVVVPFEDLMPMDADSFFIQGMTEDLVTNLGRLQPERVVMIARPSKISPTSTRGELQQMIRGCRADYILVGSVRRSCGRVRVCAQLIRSSDLSYVWADRFEEPDTEVVRAQTNLASHIARSLIRVLLLRISNPSSPGSALEAYLRGRYYWNKRTTKDVKRAVSHFEQAISINPNCSLAYVGLADSHNILGIYGEIEPVEAGSRAKCAAIRALEIDDCLPEAHASLAAALFVFDWDWAAARESFERAIQIDPAYPTAHHWYGNFLLASERYKDAISEYQCARQLDPLSLAINAWLGRTLQCAAKYDEAIQQCERTIELDPNFAWAHAFLALTYEQKRSFTEAISTYHKALALSEGSMAVKAMLGHTYAVAGMEDKARQILHEMESSLGRSHFSSMDIALIYQGLGERHKALDWLERAYEKHSPWIVQLNAEPRFFSLRSEPRFQRLISRVAPHVH